MALDEQRKDQRKTQHADASQRRPHCIERRSLLAAPFPAKAGFALAPLLMLLKSMSRLRRKWLATPGKDRQLKGQSGC